MFVEPWLDWEYRAIFAGLLATPSPNPSIDSKTEGRRNSVVHSKIRRKMAFQGKTTSLNPRAWLCLY
jgi:hypothetical protein